MAMLVVALIHASGIGIVSALVVFVIYQLFKKN